MVEVEARKYAMSTMNKSKKRSHKKYRGARQMMVAYLTQQEYKTFQRKVRLYQQGFKLDFDVFSKNKYGK